MSISLIDKIKAKNSGTFALLDDIDLNGGFRVVSGLTDRNAIDADKLKQGMWVTVLEDNKTYKLDSGLSTWSEVVFGTDPAIGTTISGGTANSVIFLNSSSQLAQSPNNFSWDSLTNILTISGETTLTGYITATGFYGDGSVLNGVVNISGVQNITSSKIFLANIGIGTSYSSTDILNVLGNVYIDGQFKVHTLSGVVNRNAFTILNNGKIGIGTLTPSEYLEISGGILKLSYNDDGLNPSIQFSLDDPASVILGSQNNSTDSISRFSIDGNGQFLWGPGNAVYDTYLSRTDYQTLFADANFNINRKVGIGTAYSPSYALNILGSTYITGELFATGAKHFQVPDQDFPGETITYTALEGNRNDIYFRGNINIFSNETLIQFPREWNFISDLSSVSVHITQFGKTSQNLTYFITGAGILIKNLSGPFIKCSYIIFSERSDIPKLKVYSNV